MSQSRWFRSRYAVLSQNVAEAVMRGHLTWGQARVWLAVFDHVNRDTGEAWPSLGRLSEVTNLDKRTVRRCLRELEQLDYLEVEARRDSAGRQSSNLYRLGGRGALAPGGEGASARGEGGAGAPLTNNQRNQEPKNQPPTPQSGESGWTAPRKKGSRSKGTSPRSRGSNPRAQGTNPRKLAQPDLDAAWRSLPSWDREQSSCGPELRRALEAVLANRECRVPPASLVMAWLARATSSESLSGVKSVEGLLIRLAQRRDPEADAAELAERVAEGRRRMARDGPEPTPEREPTPAPDPDVLTALRRAATRRAL